LHLWRSGRNLQGTGMNVFPRKPPRRAAGYRRSPAVTIRWATADDARQVDVLAELDEAPVPPAPLLLAFVGDELWVALSLGSEAMLRDPFRPTTELAALVRERGRQLTVPEVGRPRLGVMRLLSQPW
jgi:hypothetical protein